MSALKMRIPKLFLLMAVLGVLFDSVTMSHAPQGHRVSSKLLGFPFEVAVDNSLICYVGASHYLARESVYLLEKEHFTASNLETLFRWESEGRSEQELSMYVLTSRNDVAALQIPSKIYDGRNTISQVPTPTMPVAVYYRVSSDEVFWFVGAGAKEQSQRVVLNGKDPYDNPGFGFPFRVVRNTLIADQSGVECARRNIDVLMRPCDFLTPNLTQLFRWLARYFSNPSDLDITALPDFERAEASVKDGPGLYGVILMRLLGGQPFMPCPGGLERGKQESATYYRSGSKSFFYHYKTLGESRPERVDVRLD